jgi:serine/threonine protein kinase
MCATGAPVHAESMLPQAPRLTSLCSNITHIYNVLPRSTSCEDTEGGELLDYIVNHGKMVPTQALAYCKQIIAGVHYAHVFSIFHHNIIPQNLLIYLLEPPLIKIVDWSWRCSTRLRAAACHTERAWRSSTASVQ